MKAIQLTEDLFDYLERHAPLPHEILKDVAQQNVQRPDGIMQVSRSQGALMHFLCRLMGVENAVEVGCYTGYSAIAIATALPESGRLFTHDINEKTAAVAKQFFIDAGLDDKINLVVGDAQTNLAKLANAKPGHFDFAFIDADKVNYEVYYEICLTLLRPGGLVVVDNVLWSGSVANREVGDESTEALKAFNEKRLDDNRVDRVMINISDGLYLLRKR